MPLRSQEYWCICKRIYSQRSCSIASSESNSQRVIISKRLHREQIVGRYVCWAFWQPVCVQGHVELTLVIIFAFSPSCSQGTCKKSDHQDNSDHWQVWVFMSIDNSGNLRTGGSTPTSALRLILRVLIEDSPCTSFAHYVSVSCADDVVRAEEREESLFWHFRSCRIQGQGSILTNASLVI